MNNEDPSSALYLNYALPKKSRGFVVILIIGWKHLQKTKKTKL